MTTAGRPSNVAVGMTLLLFTEGMFFAGLISAYLVARSHADGWPPLGQPRLPVWSTAFNTTLLLLSAGSMLAAWKGQERRWLALTGLLGVSFVLLQGREWVKLLAFGLTTRSSIYGAYFYAIVGVHGLHALAGLLVLGYAFASARASAYLASTFYWLFVVSVWPLLYVLVYLV